MKALNPNSLKFSSLIYLGSNLINGLIPFLFLKVLTDYLTPADYGILSIYDLFIFLLIPFIGLNSGASLNRFFFDKKIDYPKLFYNVQIMTIASIVVLFGLAFAFNNFIVKSYNFNPNWIYYIVFYQLVNKLSENLLTTYLVRKRAVSYGVLRITKTSLDVLFTLLFIYYFEDKLNAKVSGQLIGVVIAGIISVFLIFKEKLIKFEFDKTYIKKALAFSMPLIPHGIGSFVINLSDQLIVKYYCGNEQLGLYAVGYKIGMGVSMIQSSFNKAWVPWFYEQLNNGTKEVKLKIVKLTYLYAIFLLLACLGLYLVAPLIFKYIINSAYYDAIVFIPYVALGFAFNGMYTMMYAYLMYIKKTKIIGLATFVIAIINIALNLILVPKIGALGAAIATTISFGIQFLLFAIFSFRSYKMPWLLR